MGRTLGEANWCTIKHLLLAKVHLEETLEKLYRSCDTKCRIDRVTEHEFLEGIKNLLAAEEHLLEVLSKKPDIEEVRKIIDEIRSLRQELTSSFLFKTEVPKNVIKVFENAVGKIQELIDRIKELKLPVEQEQLVCSRCEEDFGRLREAFVSKYTEDEVSKLCGVPTPADVIEDVMVYAPKNEIGDELVAKLREAIYSNEELVELLRKARDRGLKRIYIDCSPKNYRTIAYAKMYGDGGCVIHIHPELIRQVDAECIRHVLAHELAHCLGYLSEEEASKIASKFGICKPISISKKLKVKTLKYNSRTMVWLELGGAFIAKGIQKAGKYIAAKVAPGKKPHERPDLYMNIAAGAAGLFLALWKPLEWYGKMGLGMACKILPDLIDYVEEYVSEKTATYTYEISGVETETKSEIKEEEVKKEEYIPAEGGLIE